MFTYMDCNSREVSMKMTYEQVMEILTCLPNCDTKQELFKSLEISSRKNKIFHKN